MSTTRFGRKCVLDALSVGACFISPGGMEFEKLGPAPNMPSFSACRKKDTGAVHWLGNTNEVTYVGQYFNCFDQLRSFIKENGEGGGPSAGRAGRVRPAFGTPNPMVGENNNESFKTGHIPRGCET